MNEKLIKDSMSQSIIEAARSIAVSEGAEKVNVRKILQTLNITNRVFYNRFHNIDQVLSIIYDDTVKKIRESLSCGIDPSKDFFEQVKDIVGNTLLMSYENKSNLNGYVFEIDSVTNGNFSWWQTEIKKLIDYGKANGYLKNIDSDTMSYAIWCFIRGYNADALGRKLPLEKALADFRYSFGILLNGMRA